jgi:hypothetical protein
VHCGSFQAWGRGWGGAARAPWWPQACSTLTLPARLCWPQYRGVLVPGGAKCGRRQQPACEHGRRFMQTWPSIRCMVQQIGGYTPGRLKRGSAAHPATMHRRLEPLALLAPLAPASVPRVAASPGARLHEQRAS